MDHSSMAPCSCRWFAPWLLAAWLLGWAGCATAPPVEHPEDAVPGVPEVWSATSGTGDASVAGEMTALPDPDAWVGRFAEPALAEMVATAFTENYDLRAVAARVEVALASARITRADALPSLSGSLDASRARNVLETGLGPVGSTDNSYRMTASASWEVDLWGRLRNQTSAALADAEAADADLAGARLSLAAEVVRGYFDATAAGIQAELARESAAAFAANAESLLQRYDRGLVDSLLDVRLTEASAANSAAVAQARRRQQDARVRALEVLLGAYPSGEQALGEALPEMPGPLPTILPANLLERRPDIIAAERRLAASGARFAAARKARLPAFSLSSQAGTASTELEDLTDSNLGIWNLAANILAPAFRGGRINASILQAEARENQALAEYAATLLTAFREVETALASESFLAAEYARTLAAADAATDAEDLAWQRYRRGLVDILTALDAQRRAFDARSSLVAIQQQRLNNRVGLYVALGGSPLPLNASRR